AAAQHQVSPRDIARPGLSTGGDGVSVQVEDVPLDQRMGARRHVHAVAVPADMLVVVQEVVMDPDGIRLQHLPEWLLDIDRLAAPPGDFHVADLHGVAGVDRDATLEIGITFLRIRMRPLQAEAGDADLAAYVRRARAGNEEERPRPAGRE